MNNPIEMMNSELMLQKTMLGGQSQISDDIGYVSHLPEEKVPKKVTTWIDWFCSLEGHEFLLKVDSEFIKDKMNLICLNDKALGINFDKKRIADCMRLLLAK